MKHFARLLLLATGIASLASIGAHSAEATKSQPAAARIEPIAPINTKEDFAVHGYDPVSYFIDGQAQIGSDRFVYEWQDVRWRFVSAAHRDVFKANPGKFAPQFGGYCSLAASLGKVADGDPEQWAVVDGKLFLNNNPRAQAAWDLDRPGNIVLGNKNWPTIPKKSGSAK